jgi:recombination associated protein RdgC
MFKNARVFRLNTPFELDDVALHERLAEKAFRGCGPLEAMTMGWAPPLGPQAEMLAHGVNGCLLVAARRQERLLPASVVSEAVAERVAELEQAEGRDVSRRERSQLRDALLAEMLPQAFTRSRLVPALIDPQAGRVVVDAASDKLAEEVLSLLRESLGSLPATPLAAPAAAERFTGWVLSGAPPAGLTLADQCELRDPADKGTVVRCRGVDLGSAEVRAHIDTGMRVAAVGLDWQDALSLVLADDLSLKRLKFEDELIEQAMDGSDDEDPALRFEAEMTIMAEQLRGLLGALEGALLDEAGASAGPIPAAADASIAAGEAPPW